MSMLSSPESYVASSGEPSYDARAEIVTFHAGWSRPNRVFFTTESQRDRETQLLGKPSRRFKFFSVTVWCINELGTTPSLVACGFRCGGSGKLDVQRIRLRPDGLAVHKFQTIHGRLE